jgi:glycosyltransferase involved in cell wall biosynthesis
MVRRKFNINSKYYFCSNQFWAHKNHKVIFEALCILKKQDKDIIVVFSGKESDYRNPNFFNELKDYIKENKIEHQVKFLGFIDREEQLLLMKHSIAVIQPSLFEGWSTVVEDAKAMNQHIIISSIAVHKEQLTSNMTYFEPNNSQELANIMLKYNDKMPIKKENDYNLNKYKFANDFIKIIESLKIEL